MLARVALDSSPSKNKSIYYHVFGHNSNLTEEAEYRLFNFGSLTKWSKILPQHFIKIGYEMFRSAALQTVSTTFI